MWPGTPDGFGTVLRNHHALRIRAVMMTLEHDVIGTITNRIEDGDLAVDADADVVGSLALDLFDPERQLNLDSNSPADGALYADRMVRVYYDVRAAGPGQEWKSVPLCTMPLVRFSRDGDIVSIECQSKEVLAMGACWYVKTYRKGEKVADVIEDVMRRAGETKFGFSKLPARLAEDRTIVPEMSAWEFCQKLADSRNRQLYYDAAGRLRLRRIPNRTLWTFNHGDGGEVLTVPKTSFDLANIVNAARVVGKKPAGQKKKVRGRYVAPRSHPLSPHRLGRNGKRRFFAEFVDDSSVGTKREAKRTAKSIVTKRLVEAIDVEFDSLPIPHLEPLDVIRVKTPDFTMRARLHKFSIPLTTEGVMGVGHHRRSRPRRKKIR